MNNKRFLVVSLIIAFIASFVIVTPVSAELEPNFDWDVYRIDTSLWEEYPDYIQYDGIIYEVRFTDMTSGDVSGWNWEFGDDWWGSDKENPVKIFTEEEADDDGYSIKVKLITTDSSGVPYETEKYVYLDPDDPWNLKTIYDLTPEPTAAPTPVPTTPTQAPTPVPTATPKPTPVASHIYNVPGISKEMTKLQDSYGDYINLIKAFLGKIGIKTG